MSFSGYFFGLLLENSSKSLMYLPMYQYVSNTLPWLSLAGDCDWYSGGDWLVVAVVRLTLQRLIKVSNRIIIFILMKKIKPLTCQIIFYDKRKRINYNIILI